MSPQKDTGFDAFELSSIQRYIWIIILNYIEKYWYTLIIFSIFFIIVFRNDLGSWDNNYSLLWREYIFSYENLFVTSLMVAWYLLTWFYLIEMIFLYVFHKNIHMSQYIYQYLNKTLKWVIWEGWEINGKLFIWFFFIIFAIVSISWWSWFIAFLFWFPICIFWLIVSFVTLYLRYHFN